MTTIQTVIENYGSKGNANRVYVSAASIIAKCLKEEREKDQDAIDALNDFMSELRNRPYDTKQLPSGSGHEHEYESLESENDFIRLRIEEKETFASKQARLSDPSLYPITYTDKTLIIIPKPAKFAPLDRAKIPSMATVPSNPITQTSPDEEVNRPSMSEEVPY